MRYANAIIQEKCKQPIYSADSMQRSHFSKGLDDCGRETHTHRDTHRERESEQKCAAQTVTMMFKIMYEIVCVCVCGLVTECEQISLRALEFRHMNQTKPNQKSLNI